MFQNVPEDSVYLWSLALAPSAKRKRKEDNFETGSGLGLNISVAILGEHDCEIKVKKTEAGTKIFVKVSHMLEDNT